MGYIEETQEKLGAVITKPALTEARLQKPPVRFIHDIVNAVVAATGPGAADTNTSTRRAKG